VKGVGAARRTGERENLEIEGGTEGGVLRRRGTGRRIKLEKGRGKKCGGILDAKLAGSALRNEKRDL